MTPERQKYLENIPLSEMIARKEIAHFKRSVKICKKMLKNLPELKNVDTYTSVYNEHCRKREYYKNCCNKFQKLIKICKSKLPRR